MRFGPYRLVTLDIWRQPVRAGYVISGRYGSLCLCGHFLVFTRRSGIVDCPACGRRYTCEEVSREWPESRPRTTTTPSK